MKRCVRILVALCALFMLAKPAEAGRWIQRSCSECTGAQVWVVVLNEGAGDTKTVAKELISRHGGYLRAVWPSSKHRFAVEATQDEARAMLADSRVALVDGRSERYFSAARSRATAEAGALPETGSEFWSTGPYTYDGAGNITRIGPNVWPGSTGWDKADEFQYDRVNRLINANVTAQMPGTAAPGAVQWSEAYQYDAFGNLGMKTTTRGEGVTPETRTIEVDHATNRLGCGPNNVPGSCYDEAGNYLGVSGISATFDAMSQTTSRTVSSGTERYLYTADDERVAIRMAKGSTLYTIRGADQKVLREFEQPAVGQPLVWKKDYIWRGGSLLATVGANGKTTHFHLDHLGTPRLLTDESGNKAAMNAYLPFGEEISDGEPDTERLKFTGHERDDRASSATALDYMHARSYNSSLGRFLSVDKGKDWKPAQPQSWNLYSYVRNNPLVAIDPNGMATFYVTTGITNEQFHDPRVTEYLAYNAVNFNIDKGTATLENFKKGMSDPDGVSIYFGHSDVGQRGGMLKFQKGYEAVRGMSTRNAVTCLAACNTTEFGKQFGKLEKGQAIIGVTSNLTQKGVAGFVHAGDLSYISTQLIEGLNAGKTAGEIVNELNTFYAERAEKNPEYKVQLVLTGDSGTRVK